MYVDISLYYKYTNIYIYIYIYTYTYIYIHCSRAYVASMYTCMRLRGPKIRPATSCVRVRAHIRDIYVYIHSSHVRCAYAGVYVVVSLMHTRVVACVC